MIASLLRLRLSKIERCTQHTLKEDSEKLSPGEKEFAKAFHESSIGHMSDLVLSRMPANMQVGLGQMLLRLGQGSR